MVAAQASLAAPAPGVPHVDSRVPGQPVGDSAEGVLIDEASEQALAVRPAFADLPPPPLADGVAACETWAAKVALVCAQRIDAGADLERAALLAACCKRLGQLAPKAARSEHAAYLSEHGMGQPVDLLADEPPLAHPLCGVAWVFFRLCRLTHRIISAEAQTDPQYLLLALNVLSVAGYLSCKGELRRLLDQIKERPTRCRK